MNALAHEAHVAALTHEQQRNSGLPKSELHENLSPIVRHDHEVMSAGADPLEDRRYDRRLKKEAADPAAPLETGHVFVQTQLSQILHLGIGHTDPGTRQECERAPALCPGGPTGETASVSQPSVPAAARAAAQTGSFPVEGRMIANTRVARDASVACHSARVRWMLVT